MAVDYAGIATVIGSVATLVTAVGLTVRSFMGDHDNDDDETEQDLLDRLDKLAEKRERQKRRREARERHRDDDDTGALLSWLPRRRAHA